MRTQKKDENTALTERLVILLDKKTMSEIDDYCIKAHVESKGRFIRDCIYAYFKILKMRQKKI